MIEKRVAVITGAASGLGLEMTKACLARNMQVVMADKAPILLQNADIEAVECDVSDLSSMQVLADTAFTRFGRVDWLINNAGIVGQIAPVWEVAPASIAQVMATNVQGVVNSLHVFLPQLFAQPQRSHVTNIASVYGLCSGSNLAAYAMSKHAILALSESLFFDLTRLAKPVDVSVACPSFANTSLLLQTKALETNPLHKSLAELMSRCREPWDVAESIIQGIEANVFYILPDKEVKGYCEDRTKAIIAQSLPHKHSLEKIIQNLASRE